MKLLPLLGVLALSLSACTNPDDSKPSEDPTCDLPSVPVENCDEAHAMALPEKLPHAPGNKFADRDDAAMLGFHLFFEPSLGRGVGCPSCHLPELAFTDRLSVSKGKGQGTRNAPTTFNVARLSVIFWDGRADSLWSQPLFAIENPLEMASSRVELGQTIAAREDLAGEYEAVFGALPDMTGWPAEGKPGDAAWDELSREQRDAANRVAANVGKALEAYMRKNATGRAAFDDYLRGELEPMNEVAQRGFGVFFQKKCNQCHAGPSLTDEGFHDAGFPSLPKAAEDAGRAGAEAVLDSNVFNLRGPYADPGPGVPPPPLKGPFPKGAFRTPSLRNVTRTAPYGHDGAIATLREVLAIHAPDLDQEQQGELLAFFERLNGDYPLPPWSNWPSPQ